MNKQPVSYLQTDKRWAATPYRVPGEDSTIYDSGCGPTCAAMLISTLTGKTVTPLDTCAWSVAHGYKALHQGTYYSYFGPQFAAYGISCNQLNWTNTYGKPDSPNHAKAFDMLRQGYYLIALMGKGFWTGSGHYVVVWWEDGKVHINDPASTKDARLNGDETLFKSQVKYYWWVDARNYHYEEDIGMTREELEALVDAKAKESVAAAVKAAMPKRYEKLGDVPASYQPTIKRLMEAKVLVGRSDPDPTRLDDNILDVSEDFCRTVALLDKAGVLK